MELLNALFRWVHVLAGILWIGMLYFFNFVNAPLAAVLDAEAKRKVVPELMPRALFWFRWGAAWTWATASACSSNRSAWKKALSILSTQVIQIAASSAAGEPQRPPPA